MIGSDRIRAWADAWARHISILRASWRHQNDIDGTKSPIDDPEFLPAALEILETPPSPGARLLTIALCVLFAIVIVWSFVGKVDVVANASGKVIPAANVKVIQAIEIGAVRAIHVRNGQHVREGELLLELDPTLVGADEAQASHAFMTAELIKARNEALLVHLDGKPGRLAPPAQTPAGMVSAQERLLQTVIGEYDAQRLSLEKARAEKSAELAGVEAEVAKLQETLPLVQQQLEARRELSSRGYFSRLRLLEYDQLKVEHLRNLDVQRANARRVQAAIENLDAQVTQLRETLRKAAAGEQAEADDKSALAAEDLRKSIRRREFQALRAPVNGTVQQLAVFTIGGVVQPAQPIMVIVPDESAVAVEALVLNKDIGFIHVGQPVRVKIEAFPFTDFGIVQGKVETISRDAIQDEKLGLVYAVRITMNAARIRVGQRLQPIGPGLAVQAEIRTGRRRIIQYLLSPIARSLDEAARER
jgi:hemolysin D